MVRGEDPGEEKSTARRGGRRRCAVAMRGVWILLGRMKWKKGTDGGGVGGGKKIKREREGVLAFSAVLQQHSGTFKGVSAFCPAVVKKIIKKKSKPMSVP